MDRGQECKREREREREQVWLLVRLPRGLAADSPGHAKTSQSVLTPPRGEPEGCLGSLGTCCVP